jgi:hypothetical protein
MRANREILLGFFAIACAVPERESEVDKPFGSNNPLVAISGHGYGDGHN